MQPASVGPLMRPDPASADESTRKEKKIPGGISLSSTILPLCISLSLSLSLYLPWLAGKFDDPPLERAES